MDLQKQISIQNTPAVVDVNFDVLKESLEQELEKYQIVVTAETVADAKKLATDLNKTKKLIDDRRKQEVAKASEPVKRFDEQMKELVIMCEKGRQDILAQVQRFEDETRELCRDLLLKARDWLFDKYEVDPKFQRAEVEDLVKVSALTEKGNLTKAVKQDLEARVRDDRALQDKIARRLLELENQCYKAGLASPLTQQHVQSFMFAADEVYQAELDKLIAAEIHRQEEAEKRIREQMEKEQARKEQEAQAKPEPVARTPDAAEPAVQPEVSAAADPAQQRPAAAAGKAAYTITCTFDIEVPAALTEAQIEAELRRVMGKAGVSKTLTGIHIQRHDQAA